MALITQKQQWYLVSTDKSTDTIQILSNRLAGANRSVNLLDTYFTWNTITNNYDRLSVTASGTLVINRAYWIYVNSLVNTITGKVIDGYVSGALVRQDFNGDGTLTTGKPKTSTDITGGFADIEIDYDVQTNGLPVPLIGTGGTDIALGIPNTLTLRAYPEQGKNVV